LTGQEDKADEYLAWTIEGIQNIQKHYRGAVKEWEKLRAEQKILRGKKNRKLTRLKRRVARVRLEIAQEIGRLNLTERARQRLINAIRVFKKRSAFASVKSTALPKAEQAPYKTRDEREYSAESCRKKAPAAT